MTQQETGEHALMMDLQQVLNSRTLAQQAAAILNTVCELQNRPHLFTSEQSQVLLLLAHDLLEEASFGAYPNKGYGREPSD